MASWILALRAFWFFHHIYDLATKSDCTLDYPKHSTDSFIGALQFVMKMVLDCSQVIYESKSENTEILGRALQ